MIKADVGREISAIVEDANLLRKARTINVPVIRFAKKTA
jgi:hypothetical protein